MKQTNMKSAFFIMEMYQLGNVGSHNIRKLKANPKEGYTSHDEAKIGMEKLISEDNWELTQSWHSFTIMEIFWRPFE